jgi:hypothetical protein
MFFHDIVHHHTAAHIQALLEHFNWELFDHHTYGPDLALSDYPVYLPEELVVITVLRS